MANAFLTPDIIAREALMLLRSNMVASRLFDRGRQVEYQGQAVGDTISIRERASFAVNEFTEGGSISVQSATERSVQLTLEKHFDVSFEVTARDWTLELEDFSSQLIEPAMLALAERMDSYLLEKGTIGQYNFAGDETATTNAVADLLAADKALNDNRAPVRGRVGIMDTVLNRDILSIDGIHRVNEAGDNSALRAANVGRLINVDWFMDQNVYQHTAGTAGGATGAVNDAAVAAGATTIDLDGFTGSATLLEGDLLEIAGAAGAEQYVVTADSTATGGAFTAVAISPPLRSALADDAVVTVVGNHAKNFVGNPNAVTYAAVPLELPRGSENAAIVNSDGMGIRVVSDYDVSAKKDVVSFDILAGAVTQHPDLALTYLNLAS